MDGGISLTVAAQILGQVSDSPGVWDIGQIATQLFKAITAGNWILAGIILVVGVVYALRTTGSKWVPWLGTPAGGVVLAVLTSFVASLASSAMAGGPIGWKAVVDALILALSAMGAWSGTKNVSGQVSEAVEALKK